MIYYKHLKDEINNNSLGLFAAVFRRGGHMLSIHHQLVRNSLRNPYCAHLEWILWRWDNRGAPLKCHKQI